MCGRNISVDGNDQNGRVRTEMSRIRYALPTSGGKQGLRYHLGFFQRAQAVLASVQPLLNETKSQIQTRVVGHSLGGAVALVLGVLLREAGHQVVQVPGPRKTTDC